MESWDLLFEGFVLDIFSNRSYREIDALGKCFIRSRTLARGANGIPWLQNSTAALTRPLVKQKAFTPTNIAPKASKFGGIPSTAAIVIFSRHCRKNGSSFLTSPLGSDSSPSKLTSRPAVGGCLASTPMVVTAFLAVSGASIRRVAALSSPTY